MANEKRLNCPMRHENGNCLPAGGFCTAVNDPICEALHNAFRHGESAEYERLTLAVVKENAKHAQESLEVLREIYKKVTGPTVDAVEVVHGRWERCGGDLHSSGYAIFCSVCNKTHFVHRRYSLGGLTDNELFEKPKYCPSCGAVMEVEE